MALNPRRRGFVREFLRDRNATQAALRAGYSQSTAASQGARLLKNVGVANAIATAEARLATKFQLEREELLRELHAIATADPADAYDEDGRLLPIPKMPEAIRRAVAAFEVDELWDQVDDGERTHRARVGDTKKVKFSSKVDALRMALTHLGELSDTLRHADANGKPLSIRINLGGE